MKKKVLLLGATGSIGSSTLDIIRQFPEYFELIGIAGGKNISALIKIQKEFHLSENQIYSNSPKNSIQDFITQNPANVYINAISGKAGISSTKIIIQQKNPLCLANKESLVAYGETVMKNKKCRIIPIDSEHSSMQHLLHQVDKNDVEKIWLTASGGPFRDAKKFPKNSFSTLSPKDALNHPTWKMGAKITVDSATLMNKAFELIEAVRLFDFPIEKYQVVVHPQSIIHAAVETIDGNIIMEASHPSMHLPIARSLFSAINKKIPQSFSLKKFSPFGKNLSFEALDEERFPSLQFAKKALAEGEQKCKELLLANDEAVELFLQEKISFADIFERIGKIF